VAAESVEFLRTPPWGREKFRIGTHYFRSCSSSITLLISGRQQTAGLMIDFALHEQGAARVTAACKKRVDLKDKEFFCRVQHPGEWKEFRFGTPLFCAVPRMQTAPRCARGFFSAEPRGLGVGARAARRTFDPQFPLNFRLSDKATPLWGLGG
jgi:hypothetical protein